MDKETKKKEILDAFNFRHACKEFDETKKISKDDMNFILETARLSPSSFGFEPWRLINIKNDDLKTKLLDTTWGAQKQLPTSSDFIVILARKDDMRYDSEYIHNFMKEIQKVPEEMLETRINVFKNFQESGFKLLESERTLFDWACKQTYILLGNVMTAAAQIGIDSCPVEGFDREKTEDLLHREGVIDKNKFGISVMVAFGYRKADPSRPKTRQNIEEILEVIE
ncbi:nitroreductase [Gottschalkia purinilytica]|uniref:Nitroreductase n=1 Tax=Gottschalkia purinilytica TaxID=1503 RepID=A0A0L0W660_GOTPU|nr:NAD(P)H-dependent oxidoreductase [Gottschalkia purinilytica]KNF06957.1 nitroreductase [Gottschalkia purinilytica]